MFISLGMKLVLLVRTDVSMKKGKIAAQCCHAAVGCYRQSLRQSPKSITLWEAQGEPKVVLKVGSEEEMLSLHKSAISHNLVAVLIQDAGKTQVEAGTITALGIGPASERQLSEIIGHLKLL